jgi:hypothetical protein
MRCPISFLQWEELEHPVVFTGDNVLTVYDAESLIIWIRTSRRNPMTNSILPPLPLEQLIVPYRMLHNTDLQMNETLCLIKGNHSIWEDTWGLLKAILEKYGEKLILIAMTPCSTALGILIGITIVLVHMDIVHYITVKVLTKLAKDILSNNDTEALIQIIMEMSNCHINVIYTIALFYSKIIHPYLKIILLLYFRSDYPIVQWCTLISNMASIQTQYNSTDVIGVRILLETCNV